MIPEDELLMLLMGLGTLVLILTNYSKISRIEGVYLFLAAFFFMFTGWCLTIIEAFFLYAVFNFFEHACYLVGSVFLTCWVWRLTNSESHGR